MFGDYISVYDIQRAVFDGAKAPIYYESRLANHMCQSRRGWCGWAQPSLRHTAEEPIAVARVQGPRQLVQARSRIEDPPVMKRIPRHLASEDLPGLATGRAPPLREGACLTEFPNASSCPELMRRGTARVRPVRWEEN